MSVYRRDGYWYYDFRAKSKRYFKRVGTKKSEALAAERKARLAAATGEVQPVSMKKPRTIFDLVEAYLASGASHWSSGTFRSTASVLRQFMDRHGDRAISSVDRGTLEEYRAVRMATVSPNQVRRDFSVLKACFRVAVERGELRSNPVAGLPMPRQNGVPDRVLTEEEEARLFGAMRRSVIGSMLRLVLLTGLRRQEVCSLLWEHVHLDTATLVLPQPKTGRVKRLPLIREAVALLESLPSGTAKDPVFLNIRGHAFHPSTFWLAFTKTLKDAGLSGIRLHDLRHTVATRLVRAGYDIPTIGAILGHRPPYRETMRYFAHTSESRMREALESLPKQKEHA